MGRERRRAPRRRGYRRPTPTAPVTKASSRRCPSASCRSRTRARSSSGGRYRAWLPDGAHLVVVKERRDKEVVVDGNHPLAGKALHFEVEVIAIREATASGARPRARSRPRRRSLSAAPATCRVGRGTSPRPRRCSRAGGGRAPGCPARMNSPDPSERAVDPPPAWRRTVPRRPRSRRRCWISSLYQVNPLPEHDVAHVHGSADSRWGVPRRPRPRSCSATTR